MSVIIADSFTGELWWSFDRSGPFRAKERRHHHCCADDRETSETPLEATASVLRGLVSVTVVEEWGSATDAFLGAILTPTSFAPALEPMEWLAWAGELHPDGRILSDHALLSDDGLLYRGHRASSWSRAGDGEGRRESRVSLRLEHPLAEVLAGAPCLARLELEVFVDEARAAHPFDLECRIEALPGEDWLRLRIHEDPFWQNVTNQIPPSELPQELRSLMGRAISSELHFHPESPGVLLGETYSLRYGMKVEPASSAR